MRGDLQWNEQTAQREQGKCRQAPSSICYGSAVDQVEISVVLGLEHKNRKSWRVVGEQHGTIYEHNQGESRMISEGEPVGVAIGLGTEGRAKPLLEENHS